MNNNENGYEIDILHILMLLLGRIWIILLSTILCGAITLGYTKFFITPMYSSQVLLYVNNNSISLGSSLTFSTAEISAAKSLVDTYEVILKTRNTLNTVIERAHLTCSYNELLNMISSDAVNDTEIFSVKVTCDDPQKAELIANTIADVLPLKISNIVEGSNVSIVDRAVVSTTRISPSYLKNTAIGLLVGFVVSCGIIVLEDFFDDIMHDEDYLSDNFDLPILASIPEIYPGEPKRKYSYDYKYKYNYESSSQKSTNGKKGDK